MTGPEHYREAERMAGHCATQAAEADIYAGGDDDEISDVVHAYIALAQVHATLALAAATALGFSGLPGPGWHAWHDVAATPDQDAAEVTR